VETRGQLVGAQIFFVDSSGLNFEETGETFCVLEAGGQDSWTGGRWPTYLDWKGLCPTVWADYLVSVPINDIDYTKSNYREGKDL